MGREKKGREEASKTGREHRTKDVLTSGSDDQLRWMRKTGRKEFKSSGSYLASKESPCRTSSCASLDYRLRRCFKTKEKRGQRKGGRNGGDCTTTSDSLLIKSR